MGEAASREARAEAPTAKDPDSTKDLPIISTAQNINQPETCDEALPPVCCTPATRCGSFLSSDGPCARYSRRGMPVAAPGRLQGGDPMTGDTIRREDLIEWSGLPVGKTCALCGNGPGAGRVKWWKEADKPGSARWVCGACYVGMNGSAVEAMPPTPAATPEAVRQADDEAPAPAGTMHPELPRPGEEPAPVTPPRIRSSVPPCPDRDRRYRPRYRV